MAKRSGKVPHDKAVLFCTLLAGIPAVILALMLLWNRTYSPVVQWSLSLLVVACWLGFAAAARNLTMRPLQTMANLLLALREGDYSFRARNAGRGDTLGDVLTEINELGSVLQGQRRSAAEASALLRTVMSEIDVAVLRAAAATSYRTGRLKTVQRRACKIWT